MQSLRQGKRDLYKFHVKRSMCWDFPGGPVVKTPPFNAENLDSIPDRGNKIPHAKWHGQMKKKLT